MPEFRRPPPPGDETSLEAITRTDQLLDALASRRPVAATEPGDEELMSLMADWRDDLRDPPATGLVSAHDAVAALRSGMKTRRRNRLGLAAAGSAAAALLCLGGFGAVIYGAGPGDSLYGLHTMLFGESATRDDPVVLAAQSELEQAANLITAGQWEKAQGKLAAVTTAVTGVGDTQVQQNLLEQWNRLNVKVQARDAAATPPPGPTQVVLPDGATVQLPAAEPTSSAESPSTTQVTASTESPATGTTSPGGTSPGSTSTGMTSTSSNTEAVSTPPVSTAPVSTPPTSNPSASAPAPVSEPAPTSPAPTAQTTPVQTTPAQTTPVQTTPAQTTPAQTTPAQTTPVQTPVQTAPVPEARVPEKPVPETNSPGANPAGQTPQPKQSAPTVTTAPTVVAPPAPQR